MVKTGLTRQQAAERLEKFGPNQITDPESLSVAELIFNQLKSPLIFILFAAASFSLLLHEYTDAFFILLVVVINSALGFYQEYKAENILSTLKQKVSKTVKVIRDGERLEIDITLLVPGDVIVIEPGLKVPADAIILEGDELHANEAILTGESEPVAKQPGSKSTQPIKLDKSHRIFMGTAMTEGIGIAQVYATGDETEFGKIAASLESKFDPPTPIKQELSRISRIILVAVVLISIVVFVLGILQGLDFEEIFLTSVALGVSTIPEGLLISLTVTLALGMNRIMTRKAIVRNLPAAETLGAIEVLGIDKTGTLTEGKMSVIDTDFEDPQQARQAIAICNNDANFIDKALAEYIEKTEGEQYLSTAQDGRKQLFPFSSLKKYTAAYDGENLHVVGAPEKLLEQSSSPDPKWAKMVDEEASKGNRLVAVAYKPFKGTKASRTDITDLNFLGLIIVRDPVRTSVAESLVKIKQAGIEVKVITGDLRETSLNVLQAIKFEIAKDEMISGKELAAIETEEQLDTTIQRCKLFYRTTPDQKLAIVQSLQRQNKRVGMMGDGVNDSPAIKKAEIGISVDNATDVTKEVADVVLLDSNFETIVAAVEEGRNIFQNLRKISVVLFADALSESILVILSLIFRLPLPLLPLHILWINLIIDGIPSIAISFDRADGTLLKKKPRPHNQGILDKTVVSTILIASMLIDAVYFVLYYLLLQNGHSIEEARTLMLAGVATSTIVFLYSAKTVDSTIFSGNALNNRVLNLSVISVLVLLWGSIYWQPLQVLFETVPLDLSAWAVLGAFAGINLLTIEIIKGTLHKIRKN